MSINTIPYYYDDLWKEHEIEYLTFNNYKFIKDLSYTKNDCVSIILLFEYEEKYILRGYCDGILFPQINYFDIENIHIKKKKEKIKEIYNYIMNIFEEYNIKHTKIYLNPVDSFNLRHSLFSLIHTDYKIEQNNRLELVIYYENLNSKIEILEQEMKGGGTRTLINGFNKNPPNINIYFGDISECIFNKFIDKHFELAGHKTKSEKCWNILKTFIIFKKAVLIESNNNYVLFKISKNFCYYSINACTQKDKIVTFLLYKGIQWILKNGYNFIYFGAHPNNFSDEKNINIAEFKKNFCNKIFTNYYINR